MRHRERPRFDPLKRLALEMRVAAERLHDPYWRRVAAREAERIPPTLIEQHRAKKGEMARLGRSTMKRLPDMREDELVEAEAILKGCADAITSHFRITSESWMGQRRRRHEYA